MKRAKLAKLNHYSALAACIMATCQAEAQVVYTDVDPDFHLEDFGSFFDTYPTSYTIDFKGDGIPEFRLDHLYSGSPSAPTFNRASMALVGYTSQAKAIQVPGVTYWGYSTFADALPYGAPISDAEDFAGFDKRLGIWDNYWGRLEGPWSNKNNHYLGVRFALSDGLHYGWIRLDVAYEYAHATIKDFAYEAKPDRPISAGFDGNCPTPSNPTATQLSPTSVLLDWDKMAPAWKYQLTGQSLDGTISGSVNSPADSVIVTGLVTGKNYIWQVRMRCVDLSISSFSPVDTFALVPPLLPAYRTSLLSDEVAISPTGLKDLKAELNGANTIEVFDLSGKLLFKGTQENLFRYGQNSLPGGLFIVMLHFEGHSESRLIWK